MHTRRRTLRLAERGPQSSISCFSLPYVLFTQNLRCRPTRETRLPYPCRLVYPVCQAAHWQRRRPSARPSSVPTILRDPSVGPRELQVASGIPWCNRRLLTFASRGCVLV